MNRYACPRPGELQSIAVPCDAVQDTGQALDDAATQRGAALAGRLARSPASCEVVE
jgi:hypothetical protein